MSHWLGSFNDLTRSTYFHLPVFSVNNSMWTATKLSHSRHISYWKLTTLVPKDSWQLQSPNGTQKKKERKKKSGIFHCHTRQYNSQVTWCLSARHPVLLVCSRWALALHPLAPIHLSWHFPIFKPKHRGWESSEKKNTVEDPVGFGCWGTTEWVWAECF